MDTLAVDWGDGTSTTAIPGRATIASHLYDSEPTAGITMTAYDSDDASIGTAYADEVTVAPAAPTSLTSTWTGAT